MDRRVSEKSDLFFSSAKSTRKKTLLENIEGFKYYRNGTLKKRCIQENLVESVGEKYRIENIEGFKYYRNGTLKKRCIQENLVESVGGRNSLVI